MKAVKNKLFTGSVETREIFTSNVDVAVLHGTILEFHSCKKFLPFWRYVAESVATVVAFDPFPFYVHFSLYQSVVLTLQSTVLVCFQPKFLFIQMLQVCLAARTQPRASGWESFAHLLWNSLKAPRRLFWPGEVQVPVDTLERVSMKGIITRLSESVKLILEGPMKEGSVLLVRKTHKHRDFSFFFVRLW